MRRQLIGFALLAATVAAAHGPTSMPTADRTVTTVPELLAAVGDRAARAITVAHGLADVPTVTLSPGQSVRGSDAGVTLTFAAGSDGLRLTADNVVADLHLVTSPDRRAIGNDPAAADTLGRIELRNLTVVGRVQIVASDRVRGGHVEVDALDVVAADATPEPDRPHGYGVDALQGAFTLWNRQPDPQSIVTANLVGLSAGRAGRPVLGGGIFVAGAGDGGGRVEVQRLETGPVYSDGRIAPGTADRITGGVGVWSGASVAVVRCRGPVVTYGPNDMALDNWGTVDRWTADEPVTTRGPSGIGFVNFGTLGELRLDGPIETFGPGSRGFNVYAGTVALATFDRIVTRGDGAVGVQVSQPIGRLAVRRGIETFGGTGPSLVKGVVTQLSAVALSVKPGGRIRDVHIAGGLRAHGQDVSPLELHGSIDTLAITDGFAAADTP